MKKLVNDVKMYNINKELEYFMFVLPSFNFSHQYVALDIGNCVVIGTIFKC